MEGLSSHKRMFLLIDSQHVSVQVDHRQLILEEYTNDNEIDENASIKFLLSYSILY
jgi:hypothetical protein